MSFEIKLYEVKTNVGFCTYSVLRAIKKEAQLLENLVFPISEDWTRTSELWVMNKSIFLFNITELLRIRTCFGIALQV